MLGRRRERLRRILEETIRGIGWETRRGGVEEGGRRGRECRGGEMGRHQGLEKGWRLESGRYGESKRRKGRV